MATTTIKLSELQLILLNSAAKRETRMVLPPPRKAPLKAPATTSALKALLKRGLVEEIGITKDAPAWHTDDAGDRIGLAITPAGLRAIGRDDTVERTKDAAAAEVPKRRRNGASTPKDSKPARGSRTDSTPKASRETKSDAVFGLLRRKGGVTIAEMMEATGWQAHSVRGFLSGTVRKQANVISEKPEGGERRYRIDGAPA